MMQLWLILLFLGCRSPIWFLNMTVHLGRSCNYRIGLLRKKKTS
ncbi:hypothetical protein VB714_01305 [Spirulina sp. 06S082]|nr:hypothetical protein [Spirulina sp. 06S082]